MKNKNESIGMKNLVILVLVGVFSFWALYNLDVIGGFIETIFTVMLPFTVGGVIAFILNIPMSKIEKILNKKIKKKKGLVRLISIILSLLLFVLLILLIALLLIPELVENIKALIHTIPGFMEEVKAFLLNLVEKYPEMQSKVEETISGSDDITNIVSDGLTYIMNGAMGFVSSLVSGFVTAFTAIIFAIYMLSQKEYLIKGSKKVVYAMTSKKKANKIVEVGKLANNTFKKFISGQCTEAVILGVIMFIAVSIFRFPYALIIAVLTAITALIPVFGAMIAMLVGAILIAITDPTQVVLFVIVFLVVQQIEGNFIYPKVVGNSVGLSPMWTLFAITIGGNLFGIIGMLLGLPIASVAYAIIKEVINDRLKKKEIKI